MSATRRPPELERPDPSDPAHAPLLLVEDLRVSFRTSRGLVRAVDGVSLRLEQGQTLGLVGESGSGKSALAQSLTRLLPESADISGRLRFDGEDVLALDDSGLRQLRGRRIGMVFQDPTASLNPVRTVGAQLTETLRSQLGMTRSAATERAVDLFGQVGLTTPRRLLHNYPHELSGGMRQRVMIALALAGEPRLLIADEATTALDVSVQAQILALLRRLTDERGMSLLLITHDLGVAATVADRVAVMYSGRLAEIGEVDAVFDRPEHPYTAALLDCVPDLAGEFDRPLATIEGHAPDPTARPPGCAFAARCPLSHERCVREHPPLAPRGGGDRLAACWASQDPDAPPVRERAAAERQASTSAEPPSAVPERDSNPGLLRVTDLRVAYRVRRRLFQPGPSRVVAVAGTTFELAAGETLGLVGESGSGKSSTARAVLRLENDVAGEIRFDGQNVTALSERALRRVRPRAQLVLQDITTSLNPRFTVAEAISEPVRAHGVVPPGARRDYVFELLDAVALPRRVADWQARDLSGGQRQRVNIARALATRPDLIVADEPTSALDVSVRAQILNLMRRLQRERNLAYLFISHDLAVIRQMSDRIAVMYLGRVVETGDREQIFAAPRHPYTRALLDAVPAVGRRNEALRAIEGETPSLVDPPSGCPFHPRCARATDRCRGSEPRLAEVATGHAVACFFPNPVPPAARTADNSPHEQERP